MSVLVEGMTMPTRCEDCPVCHYMERGTITVCGCKATMMIRPIDCNSKPYWCPLVEVPTPHGRLIDADDVFHVLTSYYHHSTDFQHEALKEALARVSTIIGAEECE